MALAMTVVLETARLRLRWFTLEDAPFILRLVNEPAFLRHIGDKQVRDLDDARTYLRTGPLDSYARHGFGLYAMDLKDRNIPVGMCGLLKRETLDDVDVGYAVLSEFRGRGYAREASEAVLQHGRDTFGLGRIVAVTGVDNRRSIRLLEQLGFVFERTIRWPDGAVVRLYGSGPDPR